MQDKKDALQAREKGLNHIQEYNFAMAAIEFIRAIEAGDAQSYAHLGQLLYDGNWTKDGSSDVNGALKHWETGMKLGDALCKDLYEKHKDEFIKNPVSVKFPNGDRYKGDVNEAGQPHGSGHMKYNLNGYYADYDGMWKNGERSGKGHYHRFSKGGGASHSYDYNGEWLHDKEHGFGVATENDEVGIHLSMVSEKYTGEFREGKRHGHGVVEKDGFDGDFTCGKDHFEGKFEAGQCAGHGVMKYANGDSFEGEFRGYFEKHGHGIYTFRNGLSFEGDWQNGGFVTESFKSSGMQGLPILMVTERHHGFDYSQMGTFLIPVKGEGMAYYEEAAVITKDRDFKMDGTGLEILGVTPDSVTIKVKEEFRKEKTPLTVTINRGQTQKFEYTKETKATIYDEDYDYTIEHTLEVSCC